MTDAKCELLVSRLQDRLGPDIQGLEIANGEVSLTVAAATIANVARVLRDADDLGFSMLVDLAGLDYQAYGDADWRTHEATSTGFSRAVNKGTEHVGTTNPFPGRFAVAYQLLSIRHNWRLRVKAWLDNDPPRLPTVTEIWPVADWYEREAFDLFGILFDGHPDLRRILTDYGFIGHPFRKDFPLEGHVEVRYDAEKQRVVYQPVTIENRTLVPRVIRDDAAKGH